MRGHRRECDHGRGPGSADLRVAVGKVFYELGVLGCPTDIRHTCAKFVGLNVRQRVRQEEVRLDARVVGDEVEIRPIARRFWQVARVAAQRVRRSGRQPFVDTDVVETRLSVLDPFVVFLNELECWIGHFLIVVPPLPHETVGVIVHLGGV